MLFSFVLGGRKDKGASLDEEDEKSEVRGFYDVTFGGSSERWRFDDTAPSRIRISDRIDDQGYLPAIPELNASDFDREEVTDPDANPAIAFGRTVDAVSRKVRSGAEASGPCEELSEGDMVADRYRVGRVLGEGGMGKIYEVSHLRLVKSFAMKVLHHSVAQDKKMRSAFFREAKYTSTFNHSNLVSVLDFGEDSRFGAYMVMELVEGEQLVDLLAKHGHLSVRRSCEITMQLAEALAYIHDHNVIHCDIKPHNIMLIPTKGEVRRGYNVKILDFGLAQNRLASESGNVFGTPAYMAPEIALKEAPGFASDIYSLGILFFELVTGRVPWLGTMAEMLAAHASERPPSMSEILGEEVDDALENLVSRALSKTPADRHGDMSAFVYELRNAMHMLGFLAAPRRPPPGDAAATELVPNIDKRAVLVQATFESVRVPMATVDQEGRIIAANPAFSKFVLGMRVGLEGTRLHETAIGRAWESLDDDLEAACDGNAVGRVAAISVTPTITVNLQMWLEPTKAVGFVALSLYPKS